MWAKNGSTLFCTSFSRREEIWHCFCTYTYYLVLLSKSVLNTRFGPLKQNEISFIRSLLMKAVEFQQHPIRHLRKLALFIVLFFFASVLPGEDCLDCLVKYERSKFGINFMYFIYALATFRVIVFLRSMLSKDAIIGIRCLLLSGISMYLFFWFFQSTKYSMKTASFATAIKSVCHEILGQIKVTVSQTKRAVRETYISNIVLSCRKGVSTSKKKKKKKDNSYN